MRIEIIGSSLPCIGLGLAGCAATPPAATDVVPVHKVLDSLKCGAAVAVLASSPRTGIRGAKTTIDLHLNVVSGSTTGLDVATSPGIALYTGATLAPYFKSTYDRKYAVDTVVKFDLDMEVKDRSICGEDAEEMEKVDVGFGEWIGGIMKEVDAARAGAPLATVTGYTYDATFSITRSSTVGGKLVVIPIAADLSQVSRRDDVQHLVITITPKKATATKNGKPSDGAHPFAIPPGLNARAMRVYRQIAPTE